MRPSTCARASPPRADPRLPHDHETSANDLNSDQPSSNQGVTTMDVILLERIGKLGQMGDVVRVKDGFARNFLLPRGKALRATAENKSRFEEMKGELQTRNLELKGHADTLAGKRIGVALQFEVARLQFALHLFEPRLVLGRRAQRLAARQQEIAGEAVLHAHDVAHLSELSDAFEQNYV